MRGKIFDSREETNEKKEKEKSEIVVCLVAQLCLTLSDPVDCMGILQARILEWFAMPPPGY